jgi:hypothetical protein
LKSNQFWKIFQRQNYYIQWSEQIYAPNAIKAGVSGFVHKKEKLETLLSIIKSESR